MNQGRLRLRLEAESLLAEHAALLTPSDHEPSVDADAIERARQRVVQEDQDHGQLQLKLGAVA